MIESDNCTSQYKSAQHFHDLQEISTKYNRMLVRVFGIAGHGKGEIDHVGGLAEVAIRQAVAPQEKCLSFCPKNLMRASCFHTCGRKLK